MLYTIENEYFRFSLDENGMVRSIRNQMNQHEYCKAAGEPFRLIYQIGDYTERSVDAANQDTPEIHTEGNRMTVFYPYLKKDDCILRVTLKFTYTLEKNKLSVVADIENHDKIMIAELQTTALAGIRALNGDSENDSLLIPRGLGFRIPNPAHADFFKFSTQFRKKYERPDHIHSDLDVPYPGFSSMQWFCLYNSEEGIYIGNHDGKHRITCQHTERRIADNTLRLGMIQYPFLESGERYTTPPVVYALLNGDWHEGAKLYREWMTKDYGWKAPERPLWVKDFQGWLRVIFRTQSGEYNYHFKDIPWMFDQVQKAGLNTLFVLGWPKGGFGKLRPDYYPDEKEKKDLLEGIEYVHSKGGKLILFISYHAVDSKSKYYLEEGGERTLIKDIWDDRVRFIETYAVDGTYRKLLNPPHPQFCTCSGSDLWHEKMKKSADTCLDLGADGVLYDLGGTKPLFCFADGHDHKKPNEARASKARRYAELRANIKRFGEERIILQEHCIDIYAQHMDIVQPPTFHARDDSMPEMFRYTFPEVVMTNRNMALDEEKMLDNINFTFVYGIAFDMSIFRCSGTLRDIPNYTNYMSKIISLRKKYAKYFFEGTFIDEDGFTVSKNVFRQKAYRAKDGRLGVAVWNRSDREDTVSYTDSATGKTQEVHLEKDAACFVEL